MIHLNFMNIDQENPNVREESPHRIALKAESLFENEWLKNENLLRDEGSYCTSFQNKPPTQKSDAADAYFEELVSQLEKVIELHVMVFSNFKYSFYCGLGDKPTLLDIFIKP